MMKNLIPFLKHKYSDEVLRYFTEEAKLDTIEDEQDSELKQVTCKSDRYLEEEFKDEIGLDEAKPHVEEQKKGNKNNKEAPLCPDLRYNPELVLQKVKLEAQETIQKMSN